MSRTAVRSQGANAVLRSKRLVVVHAALASLVRTRAKLLETSGAFVNCSVTRAACGAKGAYLPSVLSVQWVGGPLTGICMLE